MKAVATDRPTGSINRPRSITKQTLQTKTLARSVQYKKTELPNGLRVISERMSGVRSAALGIWVTVGSRNETAAENGISHFIEHMAFKGTKTRSALEISRTIEQGGGFINAFTGRELTCYYVHVLDERLPQAFDILADILANSIYDPAEIEKEKQVILDEIRDHEDMPDDVAHEYFVKEVFGKHPLGRPILGSPENVRSFSKDSLRNFIDQHYVPAGIVVAAAGNVVHRDLVKLVRQKLDFLPAHKRPAQEKMGALVPRLHRYGRPIQQAHMVIGGRGVSFKSKERFSLSVMNTVLGGGMSSRLFQNIREKHGIAYSVYSFSEALGDTGLVGVYLATDSDRLDRARGMVLEEFEQLRTVSLTASEIDGVKTQIKGNIMLGLESVSNRMMRLARLELYLGKYLSLEDVSAHIDAVTPARVRSIARELFADDKLVTVIVEPERKPAARKTRALVQ